MAFNPHEHMMDLKGKAYLQVMWRLVWFREEHPDWCISTNLAGWDKASQTAVFKAEITTDTGRILSTGYGSESAGDFHDYLEKAETKAVGRALAMLGYGTQFAPDLDEGERIVDSPVEKKQTAKPRPVQQAVKQTVKALDEKAQPQEDWKRLWAKITAYNIPGWSVEEILANARVGNLKELKRNQIEYIDRELERRWNERNADREAAGADFAAGAGESGSAENVPG